MEIVDSALLTIAASAIEKLEICDTYGYSTAALGVLVNQCAHLRLLSVNSPLVNELVTVVWKQLRPGLQFVPPILTENMFDKKFATV